MSYTNGGKSKRFEWKLVTHKISIQNEDGRVHQYELAEILEVLKWLKNRFTNEWFPLANNVEFMSKGKEKDGLGNSILNLKPNDITHAQGASYLGVVLQEIGILEWNGAKKGIQWRIIRDVNTIQDLQNIIEANIPSLHLSKV